MVKGSPAVTTLNTIREMTKQISDACAGKVALFVDYLQKVAIYPEKAVDENDKVTIIVEGLKDIAMSLNVPVLANKYHILSKDHIAFNPYKAEGYREWVIFTIEKNRAGRAMIDLEFQLKAPAFCFNPRGNVVEQKLIDEKIIVE
jgi:hypothetical protein